MTDKAKTTADVMRDICGLLGVSEELTAESIETAEAFSEGMRVGQIDCMWNGVEAHFADRTAMRVPPTNPQTHEDLGAPL